MSELVNSLTLRSTEKEQPISTVIIILPSKTGGLCPKCLFEMVPSLYHLQTCDWEPVG